MCLTVHLLWHACVNASSKQPQRLCLCSEYRACLKNILTQGQRRFSQTALQSRPTGYGFVTDDGDVLIPIENLRVGDKIRVQTGKVIPVDGVVADGEATVNESSMTGEPLPVLKREGISVYAGTVIEEGSIVVTVRQLASNTKISKIIELIGNSEELKAGVQSRAETLADRIVPFSFIGFFATLIFTKNITRAVSLLMVDYS